MDEKKSYNENNNENNFNKFQDDHKINKDSESLLQEFCENTSGHGFLKLVKTTKIIRLIWIFIMIITTICLITHLFLLLGRYFDYGLNTSFYTTPDNEIIMPDITVCPNGHFSFPFINNPINLIPFSPHTVIVDQNITFTDLFNHYKLIWFNILGNESDTNLARYSIMRQSYKAKILRGKYDIIVKLDYKSKKINTSMLEEMIRYDNSICTTFKPNDRVLNFTNGNDDAVVLINSYLVGDSDDFELFTKALKEMDSFYSGSVLYLHSPGTMPNPFSDGVSVTTGKIATIAFEQNNILRYEINKNCISNPSKIILRGFSLGQTKSYAYSPYLCSEVQKSLIIYQKCGCRSELLFVSTDVPDSAPFCHELPSLFNIKRNRSFIFTTDFSAVPELLSDIYKRYKCHKEQISIINNFNFTNICVPNCIEIKYEYDISFMDVLSLMFNFNELYSKAMSDIVPLLQSDNLSLALINSYNYVQPELGVKFSIALVRITPKTLNVNIAEDSLNYPLANYFSDVGGVFGLYLGFSVISVVEILELLFKWLIINKGKCYQKSTE